MGNYDLKWVKRVIESQKNRVAQAILDKQDKLRRQKDTDADEKYELKTYFHTHNREFPINYKDKKILVVPSDGFILVPGIIENYKNRQTPEGIYTSDIRLIPKADQEDVRKYLSKSELGENITFWW